MIGAGEGPADRRLTWTVNTKNRQALEQNIFGKRILITDHNDWTVADVVGGYRSQSEIEFGFRQFTNPGNLVTKDEATD